jgi:hypothetical protein
MPWKADQSFGALPVIARQLPCDFSAMRGAHAKGVMIHHLPGDSQSCRADLSSAVHTKSHITLYSIDMMRGAFSQIKRQKQGNQMRRRRKNSGRGSKTRRIYPGCSRDYFLFCLTRASNFDSRHGLLKNFDDARGGGNPVGR